MRRAKATRFRVSTHNLHDRAGRPGFAGRDVVGFTEALPAVVRARAPRRFRVVVCEKQRDLVVVFRRRLFELVSAEYRLGHGGRERVTPHRGTFVVVLRIRRTGQLVAVVLEHRINSWWKDERGEQEFRSRMWQLHTEDVTLPWIAELEAAGCVVVAMGDLNAPRDVRGYAGELHEASTSLDRIGCSRVACLDDFRRGKRRGSDHHEISARITVPAPDRKAA